MASVLKSAVQARNSRSTERGSSRGNTDRAKVASSAEKYKLGGTIVANTKHITERIEEEEDKHIAEMDDMGSGGEDDNKGRRNTMKPKKNFLKKNILDQTKELCFEHAS
jgi:hypothetical protein